MLPVLLFFLFFLYQILCLHPLLKMYGFRPEITFHQHGAFAQGNQVYKKSKKNHPTPLSWPRRAPPQQPRRQQDTGNDGICRGVGGRQPRQAAPRIVQVGEGTTVGGQSTVEFANRSRTPLCYQCCKRIPLQTLNSTRGQPCGETTCGRARSAGLEFVEIPDDAAGACEDFQTFLAWWMDKVDHGADEAIERRSRDRVQEMRDAIP
ncbi:hypothetical protein F4802DRAFT_616907 [Xylaria palmicola]|nr:hypothetical protein F4802DRAFT_616907 [Xylaria palmicola]